MHREIKIPITIYHASQCDPKRCTGLKLKRYGLAKIVGRTRYLPRRSIVLNPFGERAFSPEDRERVERFGIVALDCSWEHAEKVLSKQVRGTSRCLPILLAGNPVNYGKATKLTTAEAIAAALYIAGFKDESKDFLSIFTWGHSFFDLNADLLEAYSSVKDSSGVLEVQSDLIKRANEQRRK